MIKSGEKRRILIVLRYNICIIDISGIDYFKMREFVNIIMIFSLFLLIYVNIGNIILV